MTQQGLRRLFLRNQSISLFIIKIIIIDEADSISGPAIIIHDTAGLTSILFLRELYFINNTSYEYSTIGIA